MVVRKNLKARLMLLAGLCWTTTQLSSRSASLLCSETWCASPYPGRIKWSGVRSGAHPHHSVRLDQHVAVTLDATCVQSYSHQRCPPPPNTTLRQPRSPARSAPALGGAFITGSAKVAPGDSSSHRAYS